MSHTSSYRPSKGLINAVLSEIKAIVRNKQAKMIKPSMVLHVELIRAVNDALNILYNNGCILVGDALNGKYIQPIDLNDEKQTE